MFNHLSKMNRKLRVSFRVKNGKVYMKNLRVTPEEYVKVAEVINKITSSEHFHGRNSNTHVEITL
jgi:hypothetical protein